MMKQIDWGLIGGLLIGFGARVSAGQTALMGPVASLGGRSTGSAAALGRTHQLFGRPDFIPRQSRLRAPTQATTHLTENLWLVGVQAVGPGLATYWQRLPRPATAFCGFR